MSPHIFLDSTPLGLASAPAQTADAIAVTHWLTDCLAAGHRLYIPEVIDYGLRRELLRAGKVSGVKEMDGLRSVLRFLPISSPAMLLAADLWASSRRSGLATGDPKKLDIDAILAAQALTLGVPSGDLVLATSNQQRQPPLPVRARRPVGQHQAIARRKAGASGRMRK